MRTTQRTNGDGKKKKKKMGAGASPNSCCCSRIVLAATSFPLSPAPPPPTFPLLDEKPHGVGKKDNAVVDEQWWDGGAGWTRDTRRRWQGTAPVGGSPNKGCESIRGLRARAGVLLTLSLDRAPILPQALPVTKLSAPLFPPHSRPPFGVPLPPSHVARAVVYRSQDAQSRVPTHPPKVDFSLFRFGRQFGRRPVASFWDGSACVVRGSSVRPPWWTHSSPIQGMHQDGPTASPAEGFS